MINWNEIRMPAREDRLWELYHENSKTSHNVGYRSSAHRELTGNLHVSLPVVSKWEKNLHCHNELLDKPMSSFISSTEDDARSKVKVLSFEYISTIVYFAIHALNEMPFPDRESPPLEVFGSLAGVEGVPEGVIHFDKKQDVARLLHERPGAGIMQQALPDSTASDCYLFITAMFQRSVLLFGEKGYRFAVSKSGRMAQSILLAGTAIGIEARLEHIFFERPIESLIGIDGVDHALLQVIALRP